MKATIKPVHKPFELELKRCYLPFVLRSTCPKCGTEAVYDDSYYLSYPKVGEPESYTVLCEECNFKWELKLRLTLNLEVVDE